MNEREPQAQTRETMKPERAWDLAAISRSRNAEAQEVWSFEDGPGWSFHLGEHEQTTLALFPGNDHRGHTAYIKTDDTDDLSLCF
jgi:hypothetical protein